MKKFFLFLSVVLTSLCVHSQNQYQLSRYGLSARGLSFALLVSNYVEIDKSFTLDSAITVPYGKIIQVRPGAIITATSRLTITGTLLAGNYKIFTTSSLIKFDQTALTQQGMYPEWWGARPMPDIRDTSITSENIDNVPAFEAAIASIEGIHYAAGKYTTNTILLSGIYGVTRTISITEKTVNIVGKTGYYNGTGFRFIGTLTGDSAQRYILEFSGSNFSRIENVAFRGKRTTDTSKRQWAAVSFIAKSGGTPQREISMVNITVGDGIGAWGDLTGGYEFRAGVACGLTGLDQNNDFFVLDRLVFRNVEYGILNNNDQAVNWNISNYSFEYGETMVYYPKGGSFNGARWYAATNTYDYVVKGCDNFTWQLRFEIIDFDGEHGQGNGLVYGLGPMRGKFTNGHISTDGTSFDGDGYKLVGGAVMQYNPMFTFEQCKFLLAGRSYLDCSTGSGSKANVRFINCTAIEAIEFKFNTGSKTRQICYVGIDGRDVADNNDIHMNGNFVVNNSNSHISGGFVALSSIIAEGNKDLQASSVTIGNRTYDPVTVISNPRSPLRPSEANDSTVYAGILKPNTVYFGVVVTFMDGGIISAGQYVKVGIAGDAEKFGRITSSSAYSQNNKGASAGYVVTTDTDIILTAFDASNNPVNMVASGKYVAITLTQMKVGQFVNEISPDVLGFFPTWGAE